jgi:two-component system LytT family response regulator
VVISTLSYVGIAARAGSSETNERNLVRGGEMSIRALVVDDEALARQRVLDFLANEDRIECIGECNSSTLAVETILRERPDLIFLDVQMPELDGFGILEAVRKEYAPSVVFTAAQHEHALRAFDYRAVDYLLKPFSKARFDEAIERLTSNDWAPSHSGSSHAAKSLVDAASLERLPFKTNGKIVIVSTEKIDWIEAERDYVRLHVQKSAYLIRETMTNIQAKLPRGKFVRIHRSTIVNVDSVSELRPVAGGEYRITLRTGAEVVLSRTHRSQLSNLVPNFSLQ